MNYKITIALFTTLAAISSQSNAEESSYGFGVGVNDGIKIYFPINKGDLIIEPTLATYGRDNKTADSRYEYKTIEVGVGVFKNKKVTEDTYMYYGGRLGYIDGENKGFYQYTSSSSSHSNEEDGYFIAPTLGVQYFLTDSISVGLDAAFMYSKVKGVNTSNGTITDTETVIYNSEAGVILRYMF